MSQKSALIARTIHDLDSIRGACRKNFHVEKIRYDEAPDWGYIDGALQHRSKGFFSIVGATFEAAEKTHHRLMLYQPQAAITGLLYTVMEGEAFFLIQARAEPGCVDEVQFGPTIQSTPANYMRLHGGTTSPYAYAFIAYDPRVRIVGDTTQSDLGERYLMKSKRLVVAEYQGEIATEPGFVWASASAISEALTRSTFLNIDLRSLLALTPWTMRGSGKSLYPASKRAQKSLHRPVRSDVMGAIFAKLKPRMTSVGSTPLDQLPNWSIDEWGIHETEPRQGFSVEFYRVQTAFREVSTWSQPLINSHGRGYCGLACRESAEGIEMQVRIIEESGLALGYGIGPSILNYPGTADKSEPASAEHMTSLVLTIESDEGGRFFKDESIYELFMTTDANTSTNPNSAWINLAELKLLLNTSNVCTIQLRNLASHLLIMA